MVERTAPGNYLQGILSGENRPRCHADGPSPITSSTTPYPSGLTAGGLGGSISVSAFPASPDGRHTPWDPQGPTLAAKERGPLPRARPPCNLGHSARLCLPPHPLCSLCSTDSSLWSRSRTRKRPAQYPQPKILICVRCPVPAGINTKNATRHSTRRISYPASEIKRARETRRVRSGSVWRHAPQPGQIRPPFDESVLSIDKHVG